MRTIKSTGNPEEDVRLVSEALGSTNVESLEEAKKRAALSNSGKDRGNVLVATPHQEGETLLVLPDADEDSAKAAKDTKTEATPKVEVSKLKEVAKAIEAQPITK